MDNYDVYLYLSFGAMVLFLLGHAMDAFHERRKLLRQLRNQL